MGGGGKSESSSSQQGQTSFDQNVWQPQGQALQQLYGGLQGLFGDTLGGMQGQIPGAVGQMQDVYGMGQQAMGQQMGGGAFQGMDLQQDYRNALQGGGNEQAVNDMIMGGAGNDYAQAMKNQMAGDAMDRLGRGFAASDLRASQAGQGGSSRHGLLQARMAEDELDRLGQQQTQVGYNTFDKDLQRKLDIGRRADQFDMGRLQNVSGMLGAKQGAMQGGLGAAQGVQNLGMGQFAPYMAPWQAAGQYASGIGRPTVLGSGTGMTSGSSDSKGMGLSVGGK